MDLLVGGLADTMAEDMEDGRGSDGCTGHRLIVGSLCIFFCLWRTLTLSNLQNRCNRFTEPFMS